MINKNIVNKDGESIIERIEAKVKWYNPEKGYGFLIPEEGTPDIFMHFSTLDGAGCRHVEAGDCIVCDVGRRGEGLQVLRILEVKFGPRESQPSPGNLDSRSLSFGTENLEEVEGEIKWFNPLKGFGFICPDGGGKDIFLPASVLHAARYESLEPGIRVLIKVASSERGREARVLTVKR